MDILGKTSERFESGNKGPSTVSSGHGDYGGVSYGTYQYSSRGGFKSSVASFIKKSSYREKFEGVLPGTPEYTRIWKEICSRDEENFGHEQHLYIKSRYYDLAMNKLKRLGLSEDRFCFGIKELVWSSAVQFGPTGCYNVFRRSGANSSMTNLEIIDVVYKEKCKVARYFRRSSSRVREGVLRRFGYEKIKNIQDCA